MGSVVTWVMPQNLLGYMDLTVTVTGELYRSTLYRVSIVGVPEIFLVKLFACKKVCVNLVESRGFLQRQ